MTVVRVLQHCSITIFKDAWGATFSDEPTPVIFEVKFYAASAIFEMQSCHNSNERYIGRFINVHQPT
jgi:hypothetical protein